MSFKPIDVASPCPALPGTGLLAVRGRDAGTFLQAQTMNDVAALAVGQWQWNGLLTPKGRVIFLFALARTGDDDYLIIAPDAGGAELKAQLQRFVFRSKLSLDEAPALVAAAAPGQAAGAGHALLDAGGGAIGLDLAGEGGPRCLWLLPPAHPALAPEDPAVGADWRLADLAHGLPRLAPGQREAWTPQMLSLERLGAFSLKKGCYPGQEIVARTHYLGQAKRGLQRLAAAAALAEAAPVAGPDGQELGKLACVASHGDRHEALAVLPAGLDAAALLAAGQPLVRLPLLGGLAR